MNNKTTNDFFKALRKLWRRFFPFKRKSRAGIRRRVVWTSDRCRIALDHYRRGHVAVVILAHGFFNNKDAYLFQNIAECFSRHYDVISFDFRGHGQSSGLFSWTTNEGKDLEAVLSYAKKIGYQRIAVAGFSLGAAITLIAARSDESINSIICVSAPYDFWKINFHFWEPEMLKDLKLNLGMKGKGKGIRPASPFLPKIAPVDIVEKINAPILFMHGANDWIIKKHHSEILYGRAQGKKQLCIIDGVGHAEKIFDDNPKEFESVCIEWLKHTL